MKAKEIVTITVTDPDSNLPVEISIFKLETGGMIGIDTSFFNADLPVYSPFDENTELEIE